jgi:hypothetical protein
MEVTDQLYASTTLLHWKNFPATQYTGLVKIMLTLKLHKSFIHKTYIICAR